MSASLDADRSTASCHQLGSTHIVETHSTTGITLLYVVGVDTVLLLTEPGGNTFRNIAGTRLESRLNTKLVGRHTNYTTHLLT